MTDTIDEAAQTGSAFVSSNSSETASDASGSEAGGANGADASSDAGKAKRFASCPAAKSASLVWTSPEGSSFSYTATAGHVDIREDNGDPIGSLFCLSYVRDDAPEKSQRPVIFAFNGGPGSASVPINVGGIGPRIVRPNGTKRIGPAPFDIIDNPDTLLRFADLVFIDALGTGWSVFATGVKGERAWGVDKDAECFARAIEAWLGKAGRFNSPLYLFGESYGTTRNAVLCGMLDQRGIALSGVVMLSAIFDWAPTIPGNTAIYVTNFPTFAAIARYHGKASAMADLSDGEFFRAASEFAETRLAPALVKGDLLDEEDERSLAQEMSAWIGLPAAYLARKHLRVEATDFRWELLHDDGKVCGRFDGRFTFDQGNYLQLSREGNLEDEDPSDSAASPAWSMAWHQVVANEIGYRNPRPYLQNAYESIGPKWDFKHRNAGAQWDSPLPNVAFDLASAMRKNPTMRVMILGGRYDLATPYLAPEEDLARMYLSDELKANISWRLYEAGHMVYINPDERARMVSDVEEFLQIAR
jgi:carboxypeptidase C (cathepsin A)